MPVNGLRRAKVPVAARTAGQRFMRSIQGFRDFRRGATGGHGAQGVYRPGLPARRDTARSIKERFRMVTVNLLVLQPLVALIAGLLILLIPRLLNYIVALYLIIVGVAGLWPHLARLAQ